MSTILNLDARFGNVCFTASVKRAGKQPFNQERAFVVAESARLLVAIRRES
jgi:hypothetical protein